MFVALGKDDTKRGVVEGIVGGGGGGGPVRRVMQERNSVGGLRRAIQRKDHHQSDKHWNRFKGNIRETSETQAGVHIYVGYFPSMWISPWTELCVEKNSLFCVDR